MQPAPKPHPGPIIVMGVSGSGKSTAGRAIAEKLGVPFLEGDAFHPAANVEKMRQGIPLTDEDRWPWLARVARELKAAAREKGGAIVSCSALRRIYRDRLRAAVGPELRFVFLDGDKATLSPRMRHRQGHFMPASLLESQFATLEKPRGEEDVLTVNVAGPIEDVIAAAMQALSERR
ncbi:MAG TPA: gluconokinase [Rhizobiaceae bacterium]|nr:gluconokinase [Rhizobiaceae bacterium]